MSRHTSFVPVRWSDIDRLGHVNNVVLLRYLQEARVDMLFRDAADRGTAGLASGVLIRRHDVTYGAPIHVRADQDGRPRPVRVDLYVTRMTAASFEIGYEVFDSDDALCGTASSVLVPYDLAGDHLRRLTADERAVLDGFRADGQPAPIIDGSGVPGTGSVNDRQAEPAAWPGDAPAYTTECAVRFDDLDSYGHVNNVMIAEYLQQGRIDLNGRLNALRDPDERQVVARLVIDYVNPIPFRTKPVTVALVVTRVGTSSFDLAYEVGDDATVYARGASTMVAYDVAAGVSRPLGDDERDALERLQRPVRAAR